MGKRLDLSKSVYELTREYPELIDVMKELGFSEITNKAMMSSVGKIMTIPKGAKMKNIPMMDVVTTLMVKGYELTGAMPEGVMGAPNVHREKAETEPERAGGRQEETKTENNISADRTEMLKGYLKRLSAGEDLEAVRADFVENFAEVDAAEIMNAEQELIKEGTPITEVQKLCDVHSALFHGATREEKIANAEKAVEASVNAKAGAAAEGGADAMTEREKAAAARGEAIAAKAAAAGNKKELAASLIAIKGHPLHTFTRENEALSKLFALANEKIEKGERFNEELLAIRELSIHYAKKGDLLYPVLKVNYNVSGPSDVMWTVDDEIRDELGALCKVYEYTDEWIQRVQAVLKRADEMIFKEANILFPSCAVYFDETEWIDIYRDAKDYADCFGVSPDMWELGEKALKEAEETAASLAGLMDGEIRMPGGHMTVEQMTAMLNTIPMEITFVDADNINRYFNEGPKVFKRAGMAIDRDVFSCHPPKIEPMVRRILDEFRNGTLDEVPVWMDKGGRTMLVKYMAVRDKAGKYLGTVEVIQDMEFAKEYFKEQGNKADS